MQVFRELPDRADVPIALTIGKFDGVHLGHRAVIEQLRHHAAHVRLPACVLSFDPHPAELFARDEAPLRLTTAAEKIGLLASCGIDRLYLWPFTRGIAEMSPRAFVTDLLVARLAVQLFLVGDDFRFGARREGSIATLQELGPRFGFEVVRLSDVAFDGARISSTAIRQAIARGDSDLARRLLGRDPTESIN